MKKIIAMLLAAVLCLGLLAGCSSAKSSSAAADGDLAYIKQKGTLVIGITEFEPIDYQDEKGNWIGFDADMATAFAESLGVKPVFQIINWDNKAMELDGKTIDVVWNGMTLNDEVKAAMSCSNPYFNNAQVAVVKAADKDKYATVESLKDAQFAVENGSAGQKQVTALGYKFTPVEDQATALTEVQSGTSDAAVIDLLMAKSTIGEGTSYAIRCGLPQRQRRGRSTEQILQRKVQRRHHEKTVRAVRHRSRYADRAEINEPGRFPRIPAERLRALRPPFDGFSAGVTISKAK